MPFVEHGGSGRAIMEACIQSQASPTVDIWTDLIWWAWLDMQGHAERNIERGVKMWLVEREIP